MLMQQLCASFNNRQPAEARLALRIASIPANRSPAKGDFRVAAVIASRLCATAQEGQVLVSEIARSLVEPRGVNQTTCPWP